MPPAPNRAARPRTAARPTTRPGSAPERVQHQARHVGPLGGQQPVKDQVRRIVDPHLALADARETVTPEVVPDRQRRPSATRRAPPSARGRTTSRRRRPASSRRPRSARARRACTRARRPSRGVDEHARSTDCRTATSRGLEAFLASASYRDRFPFRVLGPRTRRNPYKTRSRFYTGRAGSGSIGRRNRRVLLVEMGRSGRS